MRRYCCIPWLLCELAPPLLILGLAGWGLWHGVAAAHRGWLKHWTAHAPASSVVAPHSTAGGVILWFGRVMPLPLTLLKLIAFVLLLALLYLIARLVAQRKQRAARVVSLAPQPALPIVATALHASPPDAPQLSLGQVSVGNDALCVPPRIHNYHFAHTDLVRGPDDPRDFYDDFFLEMEDARDGHRFTEQFTVATPAGMARLMRAEGVAHLFPENFLVISNFNLGEILTAVLSRYADFRPESVVREHTTP